MGGNINKTERLRNGGNGREGTDGEGEGEGVCESFHGTLSWAWSDCNGCYALIIPSQFTL